MLEPDTKDMDGILAQAVVNTVSEPLVVLDEDMRITAASRSFYQTFEVNRAGTVGRLFYEIGNGEWDIPALRALLERVIPEQGVMKDFEVDVSFPLIGQRAMLLNARKVFYTDNSNRTLLLAIEDVTERRTIERQTHVLLEEKDLLLKEMSHRVANSLQIIAGILLMKARSGESDETKQQLQDAYRRVLSVASVQRHLRAAENAKEIVIGPYLSQLCDALATSLIGEHRAIVLKVVADQGTALPNRAVSLGLVVTELVINAVKHAFGDDVKDGCVTVGYEAHDFGWNLSVADNGRGMPSQQLGDNKPGLGTSLVNALAQQLAAEVRVESSPAGTIVSLDHATLALA